MLHAMTDALTAGLAPLKPPARWFTAPEPDEATPLTVLKTGQVYGHAALWDSCYTGYENMCLKPPRSVSGYAYFHLGEVECADGSTVACGQITLDTPHAPTSRGFSADAASRHYADTGVVVADVCCSEGVLGPWLAGAIRPNVDAERIRELRAAKISGDWRKIDGSLELIAALAVNVPGFPIPRRRALVASLDAEPELLALVAGGIVLDRPPSQSRLAALHARATGGLDALAKLARGA